MATKKTEEDLLTAELLRLRKRLAKMNLSHLEVAGFTVKPVSKALFCKPGFEPRMVKMPDGSFKLQCRKKIIVA